MPMLGPMQESDARSSSRHGGVEPRNSEKYTEQNFAGISTAEALKATYHPLASVWPQCCGIEHS